MEKCFIFIVIFISIDLIKVVQTEYEAEGITGRMVGSWAELVDQINILDSVSADPGNSLINHFLSSSQVEEKSIPVYHKEFCGEINVVSSFQRIVGGTEVKKGAAPWQVGIALQPEPGESKLPTITCGGSLLTEYTVVTAAHCLPKPPSRYEVHIGRHHSNLKIDECHEQKFKVMKYILHPDFEKKTLKNDIAIVSIRSFFGQGVQFTNWIVPACIGHGHDFYEPDHKGTVTGWGLMDETKDLVVTPLLKVDLPIVSDSECRNAYKKIVNIQTGKQFCAGESSGGKDACSGDSGGPFTRTISSSMGSRYFLIGVVSYGMGCARSQYPGVYTKITTYLPWIQEQVQSFHNEANPTRTTTTSLKPITTTQTTTTTTTKKATTTTKAPTTTTTTEAATTPTTFINLSDDIQEVGPVCKDSYRYLRCTAEQTIKILSVFYGRKDESTCGVENNEYAGFSARAASLKSPSDCEYEGALPDLVRFCKGKRYCYVNTLTDGRRGPFRPNKCESENPYVYVQYSCQNKKEETTFDVRTQTKDICNRDEISCETGSHLKILSAVLQRSSYDNKPCETRYRNRRSYLPCSDDVLEPVQKYCDDKRSCSLTVRTLSRQSRCRRVNPYLSVKYTCIISKKSTKKDGDLEDTEDGGPPTTGGWMDPEIDTSDLSDESNLWQSI